MKNTINIKTSLNSFIFGKQNYFSVIRRIDEISAFTLVELMIVVTILSILRTIGFISYKGQIESTKNTTRTIDLGNLSISLKNHKLKNGVYPLPGDYFNIVNSGSSNIVAYQGFMNNKVYSTELQTNPLDPDYKIPYIYSVNSNKNYYQIRATLVAEDDTQKDKAYLIGDYQTVSKDILPTLILATSTGAGNNIEIASGTTLGNINRLKFIVNNGTQNLPYNSEDTKPISTATSFSSIFSESGIEYPQYPGFSSCLEIYEAGRSIGSGSYQILDNNGAVTSTGCSMVFGVQPYNQSTTYVKGDSFTYDSMTWYVSANTKVAYTKQSLANDLPNNLTATDHILVFSGNEKYILKTVNQGATQVYNYGTSYTSGRLWNEGSTYGADSSTRKIAYEADKSMLGDYYQWGRNDPVSLTGTTTSLDNTHSYQTGGVTLGTNYGFIINPNSPYSWLGTNHASSSSIIWTDANNPGPCLDANYRLPSVGFGEWRRVVEIVTGMTSGRNTTERQTLQKYLLLPFAGYRGYSTGNFDIQGSIGVYWSSSINGDNGYNLRFDFTSIIPDNSSYRANGFSVRCFKN